MSIATLSPDQTLAMSTNAAVSESHSPAAAYRREGFVGSGAVSAQPVERPAGVSSTETEFIIASSFEEIRAAWRLVHDV